MTVSGCVLTSHVSTNTSGGSVTSHPPQLKRWPTLLLRRQRFSLSLMPSRDTISAPWTRRALRLSRLFKFLLAPCGISSISEHYNRRMDEAFAGLKGYHRFNEVVIFDRDTTLHPSHVKMFLQHCEERQITLNTEKWVYANGYSIDNSIVSAISSSLNLLIVLTFAHLLAW